MTDLTRNTRTLIVCFIVAIFGLLPLRFYEEGQKMAELENKYVLGTYEEVASEEYSQQLSAVAEAQAQPESLGLEAPYNEYENQLAPNDILGSDGSNVFGVSCISESEAELLTAPMIEQLNTGVSSEEELMNIRVAVEGVIAQICR